jgi:hypothetical protein
LSTFQHHLIGLEKHEKHGPEWIRQVQNDPKILKLVDLFDNRIKANSHGHKTLRSRWGSEVQSDKPKAIRPNGLIYGQNGAVCTEVKGPKNKGSLQLNTGLMAVSYFILTGFRVIIPPSVPQERPTPFVSRQSSTTQTPSLTSSSSSSSLSPPQRHQQHSQMLNNNCNSNNNNSNNNNNNNNINMPAPIDIDDYSDVMYDDNFDQEYLLEQQHSQQQVPNKLQQQPNHNSDVSFGDDEEFERSIINQMTTPADNQRIYSILDSYDFDEVENVAGEQVGASYPDFDFDMDHHQVVQNHNNAKNVVSNNNNSDDDDAFDAYVHRINYSDQDDASDPYSEYSPFIYIKQRYLRPKPKVQIVQQVFDASQQEPTFYSRNEVNSLSCDEHYEPVILIKASEKRKACFLFEDETESTVEPLDQDDFIDDSLEGEIVMSDDEEGEEQESSKKRQKKKSVFVLKNKNKIRIRDEVMILAGSDTDDEEQDDDEDDDEDEDDDGATADMLDRLKKSNLFDLYNKRMSGYKK